MKNFKRKYTFERWFKHWLAFNKTAYKLKAWRIGHLLHDIDKPFLNLFLSNEKTREIHLKRSPHHMEYNGKLNIEDMIIDWECARLTKPESQLNARETLIKKILPKFEKTQANSKVVVDFYSECMSTLRRFNL